MFCALNTWYKSVQIDAAGHEVYENDLYGPTLDILKFIMHT